MRSAELRSPKLVGQPTGRAARRRRRPRFGRGWASACCMLLCLVTFRAVLELRSAARLRAGLTTGTRFREEQPAGRGPRATAASREPDLRRSALRRSSELALPRGLHMCTAVHASTHHTTAASDCRMPRAAPAYIPEATGYSVYRCAPAVRWHLAHGHRPRHARQPTSRRRPVVDAPMPRCLDAGGGCGRAGQAEDRGSRIEEFGADAAFPGPKPEGKSGARCKVQGMPGAKPAPPRPAPPGSAPSLYCTTV